MKLIFVLPRGFLDWLAVSTFMALLLQGMAGIAYATESTMRLQGAANIAGAGGTLPSGSIQTTSETEVSARSTAPQLDLVDDSAASSTLVLEATLPLGVQINAGAHVGISQQPPHAVPEPSSLVLAGLALAGIALTRRRKS